MHLIQDFFFQKITKIYKWWSDPTLRKLQMKHPKQKSKKKLSKAGSKDKMSQSVITYKSNIKHECWAMFSLPMSEALFALLFSQHLRLILINRVRIECLIWFKLWLFSIVCCLFYLQALTVRAKGQLFSKCLFDVFNFSQKTNENKSNWGIIRGQLISKCLFGVFNSTKKQTKVIRLEVP